MTFRIQAGTPQVLNKKDVEDVDLNECIQTMFPLETDDAFMRWQGIFIPLTYKYTLSIIFLDILEMLQKLISEEAGELRICWPSNDFCTVWQLTWKNDNLTIETEWFDIVSDREKLLVELLNKLDPLKVPKPEFIYEWKDILSTVIKALEKKQYTATQVPEMKLLYSVFSKIKDFKTE